LRKKNRERQRKWRANNLTQAQLKERNASRIRRGTMEPMPAPEPNVNLTKGFSEPNSDISAPNAVRGYGETHEGPIEGVDTAPTEYGQRGPVPRFVGRKVEVAQTMDEGADVATPPASSKDLPPNEVETYRQLGELEKRKAAGKLGRADGLGVHVDLKL
jgi:hypothetical protein